MKGNVILLSGGLDSTLAMLLQTMETDGVKREHHALFFNYNQANLQTELRAAARVASALNVDITAITVSDHLFAPIPAPQVQGDSVLVEMDGPGAYHNGAPLNYAFTRGRNLAFLSLAAAFAARHGHPAIVASFVNTGSGFPDTTPIFVASVNNAIMQGSPNAESAPVVLAPFIGWTKAEALRWALKPQFAKLMRADPMYVIGLSHSCYQPHPACGVCPACVSRAKAFEEVGVVDPRWK